MKKLLLKAFTFILTSEFLRPFLHRELDELLKIIKQGVAEKPEAFPYIAPKIGKVDIPEFDKWAENRNKRIAIKKKTL